MHGLEVTPTIDFGSDPERSQALGGSGVFSMIENTWNPSLNRAISEFDTRHFLSWDWVYGVPFGCGLQYGSSMGRAEDLLPRGWQFSGLGRWSSGLPLSLTDPGYTTDWEFPAFGVANRKVQTKRHLDANGKPQVFVNPDVFNNRVQGATGPVRLPYPGEAGERNIFRGDGFFEVDSSLSTSWSLFRESRLRAAWEMFNATNSVRFDTNSNTLLGTQLTSGSLGKYSEVLNRPRIQQFSARIDF